MAAKYKKIDPRMWNDEKFRSLSHHEKLIAIYVITAQSNRIGFFVFSIARGAEELGMSNGTFREGFRKVCERLNWAWNEDSKTVFLPTWWKYNPPEGPNIIKGCLNDIHDLPETPLMTTFCGNTKYLFGKVKETFLERIGKVYPQLRHEQEHEHKQDNPPLPPKGGKGQKRKREYGTDEEEAEAEYKRMNSRNGADDGR